MNTVDPWMAGKARLAEAKAGAATAKIQARAEAAERRADREDARREAARQRRRDEQNERKAARSARLTALGHVLRTHWQLALWLPVIVAPGILAWEGQTDAGNAIFGAGLGFLLALFTETSGWALLARAEIRQRAGAPVAATRAAAWVVALIGAALNYTHGAQDPGASWHGIVMALVSVSGFAVHQVAHCRTDVLAALRSWWTGRATRRLARLAARRVDRFERLALRQSIGVLGADGTVELIHAAGAYRLKRARTGRTRIVPTVVPGLSVAPVPSLADTLAAEAEQWLRTAPRVQAGPAETASGAEGRVPSDHDLENSDHDLENDADDDAQLIRRVLDALAAGDIERPTNTAVRVLLNVRKATADRVARAVRSHLDGDDDGRATANA